MCTIRLLERWDFPQVLDLMIDFARATGLREFNQKTYDPAPGTAVLMRCLVGGVSYVAADKERIVGMILSLRDQDMWIPSIVRVRELAWWVDPQYRASTVGGRLFHKYTSKAQALVDAGLIQGYTMTKLTTSPDFDYERRGFRLVESTYIKGGA